MFTCLPSRGVANRTQNPFNPTHTNKVTQAVAHEQRLTHNNNKHAESREARWLKEVRKVKGIEKGKVGNKTQGEKVKKLW